MTLKDLQADGTLLYEYNYTYDQFGQGTNEDGGDINAYLNRVTVDVYDREDMAMTYSADNRLATVNGEAVKYDAEGNMLVGPLAGQMQNYTFDAHNRLVQAGGVQYGYDNENHRTSMTVNGTTTKYVINPEAVLSQVLMETDASGKPTAWYVYGNGLIGRQDANGAYQSYHYDRRGSTIALTDAKGQLTDTYSYGTYGESLGHEGTTEQPFQYNGRDGVMTDPNGLYQMRARYYNPEIKRFVNRDVLSGSIDDGLTMNRYAYVNGNPISYIDPFGLSADSDEMLKTIGSFLADAVPGLGTLKGLQEIFTGVNYITGDQLSVADRVANGGGVLLSWVPGGKIAGKALTKGAIDGGSWVIARVAKTPGKYLESPAEINGTLNIGARGKPIEGTYNIDIDPKSQGVHYGDATQLTNIKTGSQNKIIIENPYGYDPLNSEILRVLSKDGEIIITGSRSNMKKILRQLEEKGLQVKGERRDVANDGTYLTTDGEIIKSEFLDQYIFVRK